MRRGTGCRGRRSVAATIIVVAASLARAQEPASPLAPPGLPEANGEPATPDARFKRGTNFFEYGDCGQAVEVLAPLAQPGLLKDEREQMEVHRMLGVCFYQLGRIADASRELNSLLYIDPDYTLDPFLTPPPVVELFEAQKAGIRTKLAEIRRARERELEAEAPTAGMLVTRTTTVRQSPFVTIFLPFGLAQIANGEIVKGVVFGSVQGALLATNVGAYWATELMSEADGPDNVVPAPADTTTYTTLAVVCGGALVLAVAAYGVGVVDAWWFREDREVVEDKEERRPLTPDEVKALRRLQE